VPEFVTRWWDEHGTKILGFGGVAIGALEYVDAQTIHLVATIFGPTYGPIVSQVLTVIGGFLVARRGFLNSVKNNGPSN
jgi:hypothetical protein